METEKAKLSVFPFFCHLDGFHSENFSVLYNIFKDSKKH